MAFFGPYVAGSWLCYGLRSPGAASNVTTRRARSKSVVCATESCSPEHNGVFEMHPSRGYVTLLDARCGRCIIPLSIAAVQSFDFAPWY